MLTAGDARAYVTSPDTSRQNPDTAGQAANTKHRQLCLCLCWLAPAKGLELLLACLEPTMTKLGGCVNELKLDLLQG